MTTSTFRRRWLPEFIAGSLTLRQIDRDLAHERESGLHVSQNAARMRTRLSNKAWGRPRRDPLSDRDISLQIHMCLEHGAVVRVTGDDGAPVIRWKHPLYTPYREELEKALKTARRKLKRGETWEEKVWLPLWSHTGERLKIWACSMYVQEQGGWATSVNLSDDVIEAAHACRRGFTWYVRDLIQKELKAAFSSTGFAPPDFFFVMEASDFHQVHIQGGVCGSAHPKAIKLVRNALFRIGRHSERTGREVDTESLSTATNWASYITKWFYGSQFHLGGPVFTATNDLRKGAGAWYDNARRSGRVILPYRFEDDLMGRIAAQAGTASFVRSDIKVDLDRVRRRARSPKFR